MPRDHIEIIPDSEEERQRCVCFKSLMYNVRAQVVICRARREEDRSPPKNIKNFIEVIEISSDSDRLVAILLYNETKFTGPPHDHSEDDILVTQSPKKYDYSTILLHSNGFLTDGLNYL